MLGQRVENSVYNYGYKRAEIMGALSSMAIIWVLTIWLVYKAFQRFFQIGVYIDAEVMLVTSVVGIVCNLIMGFTLHAAMPHDHDHGHDHEHEHNHNYGHIDEQNQKGENNLNIELGDQNALESQDLLLTENTEESSNFDEDYTGQHVHDHHSHENMNMRAAFLHVLGDLIQSISVFILAIILYCFPSYKVLDPLLTLIFSLIVIYTTIPLSLKCLRILMQTAPKSINIDKLTYKINSNIQRFDCKVKELKIWELGGKKCIASIKADLDLSKAKIAKNQIRRILETNGVVYSTIENLKLLE